MLKFPIYSVLVSQEATSSPEDSNTLLGSQLPSQDGKWKDAGLFLVFLFSFLSCWNIAKLVLSLSFCNCLPLCAPWLHPGSLKGQLEPLNEVG